MQRVCYLEQYERDVYPHILPEYFSSMPDEIEGQRAVCVDRIYRLGIFAGAMDTTCFSTVRLFDRCMSIMKAPIVKTNMMLLAIACFDIVHKASDSDVARPSLVVYYREAMMNHDNDFAIKFDRFREKLKETEIMIMCAVDGQPVSPSAQEYIAECFPAWFQKTDYQLYGRKASLLCNCYLYIGQSTIYTTEQIAAAAARVTIAGKPSPSFDMYLLCNKIDDDLAYQLGNCMMETTESLFRLKNKTSMCYAYQDMYVKWSSYKS